MTTQLFLDECFFVIFGGAGDLTKRKLIPALYKLINDGRVKKIALLAVSIDDTSIQEIILQARNYIPHVKQHILDELLAHAYYFRMDFHDDSRYTPLQETLATIEHKEELKGNKIFYFATMPEHFNVLTENLAKHMVVTPAKSPEEAAETPWTRLIFEKPFGKDLASAQAINRSIGNIFHESQIFRIDHYLGKELVGNIALVRFTNQIFEPLWNSTYIDSVQIVLSEQEGIGSRGLFYDQHGALRDMVQSHMLQILALIAMEKPLRLTAHHIRDAKANVLQHVTVNSMIRGQYEGYLEEPFVKKASTTESFVALKCLINNSRWSGVPFYLKTGKFLEKKEAAIYLRFKAADCLLDVCPADTNYLAIKIHPHEGMYLGLNIKVPGVSNRVMPVSMDFSHNVMFGPNTPEAYEILLADVMANDHSAFVRSDEIEHSWNIIEQTNRLPQTLYPYKKRSHGPQNIQSLDPERIIDWLS